MDTSIKLTYDNLRALLDDAEADGRHVSVAGDGAVLIPGHVTIHDHPRSDSPREIHFMVDGIKIAELGPPDGPGEQNGHGKAPGYLAIIAEWMGQPVYVTDWKNRILTDNGLLPGRGKLDALAESVLHQAKDATMVRARLDREVDTTIIDSFIRSAVELAEQVQEAHVIHATYEDALALLQTSMR